MAYKKTTWVDDDGSLTVGTLFSATNMNNIETGISGLIELLEKSGVGVVIHGTEAGKARAAGFEMVIWIGTAEPEHAAENDLWVNPEDFGINSSQFIPTAVVFGAAQSIPNNVSTALTFASEKVDNAAIHSTSSNTQLFTAPKAGVYLMEGHIEWAANSTGNRALLWYKNTQRIGGEFRAASATDEMNAIVVIPLEAGDTMELRAYQNITGGAALATIATTQQNAQEASMTYLGTGTVSLTPVDWGLVTELPSGAGLGDICKLKVRENESAPWKVWDCVKVEASGERPWAATGPPLREEISANQSTTSKTYADLTTAGPSVTAPVNGEYLIKFGALIWGEGENYADISVNGAVPGEDYYVRNNANVPDTLNSSKKRVIPKGQTGRIKYRAAGGQTLNAQWRWIELQPMRLG